MGQLLPPCYADMFDAEHLRAGEKDLIADKLTSSLNIFKVTDERTSNRLNEGDTHDNLGLRRQP